MESLDEKTRSFLNPFLVAPKEAGGWEQTYSFDPNSLPFSRFENRDPYWIAWFPSGKPNFRHALQKGAMFLSRGARTEQEAAYLVTLAKSKGGCGFVVDFHDVNSPRVFYFGSRSSSEDDGRQCFVALLHSADHHFRKPWERVKKN